MCMHPESEGAMFKLREIIKSNVTEKWFVILLLLASLLSLAKRINYFTSEDIWIKNIPLSIGLLVGAIVPFL